AFTNDGSTIIASGGGGGGDGDNANAPSGGNAGRGSTGTASGGAGGGGGSKTQGLNASGQTAGAAGTGGKTIAGTPGSDVNASVLPQRVHQETESILPAVHFREQLAQVVHLAAPAVAVRPMEVPVQLAQVPTPEAVAEAPLIPAPTAAMAVSRE